MFFKIFSKGLILKKISIIFFFILLITPFFAFGFQAGDQTPNIFGRTIKGQLFKLSSLKGTPVVISFFSVKCKPCKKELPEIANFEKQFKDIKFVAVSVDDTSVINIKKFIKKLHASPKTIVMASLIVKKDFKIYGLPHTIIVDSNGFFYKQIKGYSKNNMKILKKWILKIDAAR